MSNKIKSHPVFRAVKLSEESTVFWDKFLFATSLTFEQARKMTADDFPVQDIGVDFILAMRIIRAPGPQMSIVARVFIENLVPEPDEITSWQELFQALEGHTGLASGKAKATLAQLGKNPDFQKKFKGNSPNSSHEDWAKQVAYGEIFKSLLTAFSFLRMGRLVFLPEIKAYGGMISRLKTPLDLSGFCISENNPKLFITAHSNFRADFVAPVKTQFSDTLYTVVAESLSSVQKISVQRIIMVKSLKKGKSVLIAADGKKGSGQIKGRIFGNEVSVATGFAWVAWQAKSEIVWTYAGIAKSGKGLQVFSNTIQQPIDDGEDCDAFIDKAIAAYLLSVEQAIIQHPFDFGLLYPRRLGEKPRTERKIT
ncbi:MAG: hypothetical protein L3J33_10455 [Rhodobacteraceae bacterium]|nr:hypothetical protein [Paracoccaceae bacterium]